MVSHVADALERLTAYLAGEGRFAAVNAHVHLEIPLFEEGFLTNGAQDALVVVFPLLLRRSGSILELLQLF